MSITYCHNCNKNIDEDIDVEHFDVCGKEEDYVWNEIKNIEKIILNGDGDYILPVVPVINNETGEIKLFPEKVVKSLGMNNILERLNNEN